MVSTIVVTIVVLIFGEILPKTIAKSNAETFACAISGIMSFLMTVFTPLSAIFILLQKGANKLFASKNKEVSMEPRAGTAFRDGLNGYCDSGQAEHLQKNESSDC